MSPASPVSTPPALDALARMIGNTPLLAIDFRYRGSNRVIHAKCEHLNLTGSIKDRMALHILRRAYESGQLQPGDRVVEATSGNTGISFAALSRAMGHPATIFMPSWMSAERKQLIGSYGAEIVPVSAEQGGLLGSIRMAEEMAERTPHVFLPRQFSNQANIEPPGHRATRGERRSGRDPPSGCSRETESGRRDPAAIVAAIHRSGGPRSPSSGHRISSSGTLSADTHHRAPAPCAARFPHCGNPSSCP